MRRPLRVWKRPPGQRGTSARPCCGEPSIDPISVRQLEQPWLSNAQSPQPDYTAQIVGRFLRKLYTDMLEEEFHERLQPLIEKLDAQERAIRSQEKR